MHRVVSVTAVAIPLAAAALLADGPLDSLGVLQHTPPPSTNLAVQFSSYLGGGSFDWAQDVAVDQDGNVYTLIGSQSRDYGEARSLPPNEAWLPTVRSFITRIDRRGAVVHWRFDDAFITGLAVDAAGAVYVAGTAVVPAKSRDAFFAKLDRSGATVYSATFGGTGAEDVAGLAVDAAGNVVVVGGTWSRDFPLVAAAQLCTSAAQTQSDAFVAQFDRNGALARSTCLGGSDLDQAAAVAIDPAGNVHVMGWTRSADFRTTPRAVQRAFGGGTCAPPRRPCSDLFVVKLNGAGPQIIYASFFGGSNEELPGGLSADGAGSAYISGWTTSRNLPTSNALQHECRTAYSAADCGDGFVAKLAADGTRFVYSTYLGGSRFDSASDVVNAADGTLYVVGDTVSSDFVARRPSEPVFSSPADTDGYVLQLDAKGLPRELARVGGGGDDIVFAVANDARGAVYLVGMTRSGDFPILGDIRTTLRGEFDGFIAQLGVIRLPGPQRRGP